MNPESIRDKLSKRRSTWGLEFDLLLLASSGDLVRLEKAGQPNKIREASLTEYERPALHKKINCIFEVTKEQSDN